MIIISHFTALTWLKNHKNEDDEITFRVEESRRNFEEGMKTIENLENWEKEEDEKRRRRKC